MREKQVDRQREKEGKRGREREREGDQLSADIRAVMEEGEGDIRGFSSKVPSLPKPFLSFGFSQRMNFVLSLLPRIRRIDPFHERKFSLLPPRGHLRKLAFQKEEEKK
jgi:hypothetical protein